MALGTVKFTLVLGQVIASPILTQNFDDLMTPKLPADWSTSATGGDSTWSTITNADSGPNAAFIFESDSAGASELVSPAVTIGSGMAQLTFRNKYDTEVDPNPTKGYDGGVLEIQIDGGSFIDIQDAGGIFVTGGYTATLDPLGDNPFAGRRAWSGDSRGFITTTVNLPATAARKSVRFKWNFGMDTGNGYGGNGWWVDTISIQDFTYACCTSGPAAPFITQQPTNQTTTAGANVRFDIAATSPSPLSYQWHFNNTSLSGETSSKLTLTNVQPSQMGVYSVEVTNAAGWTLSSNAWLKVLVIPILSAAAMDNANPSISLNSVSSLTYALQYKNWLSDPMWVTIPPSLPGTGGRIWLADTNAYGPRRFYRVVAY